MHTGRVELHKVKASTCEIHMPDDNGFCSTESSQWQEDRKPNETHLYSQEMVIIRDDHF